MTNKKTTKTTALMLAGVLVTSSLVGGTMARYITTTMSEDSARVAVWGINADGVVMDLFASEYDANGNKVAKSWNGDKLIAPGTSMQSLFSIVNLDGSLVPEVMYEIKVDVDDTEIDQRILDNPNIQWKLDDNAYGTWATCKADILALSGDASGVKTYAPNTFATEFADGKTHTIYWRWMLDDNHVQDTEMGNQAVYEDIVAKIAVKVTARQVQDDTTGLLNGDGQTFNSAMPTNLTFRSASPITELERVEIDGIELDSANYTATEGSTVITISQDFLSTLSVGNHTISIVSRNATVNTTFTVVDGVVSIGENTYISLQDAIEDAEDGAVIKFTENVALEEAVDINKALTFDLNGKTLTLPDLDVYAVVVRDHLTINDSSPRKTGGIHVDGRYGIATSTTCTGGITINGGKFTTADTSFYTIGAYAGVIEINNGEFTSPYCNVNSFDRYTATANIKGGTFTVTGDDPEAAPLLGINFNVTGGTYSEEIPETYIATGYTSVDNGDGTYSIVRE